MKQIPSPRHNVRIFQVAILVQSFDNTGDPCFRQHTLETITESVLGPMTEEEAQIVAEAAEEAGAEKEPDHN